MTIKDVPFGYVCCFATSQQCLRRDHCLRYKAACMYEEQKDKPCDYLMSLTPAWLDKISSGESCTYFRSDEPVRFAKGMHKVYDDVPQKLYSSIRTEVKACFSGKGIYYKARAGEILINPAMQKKIKAVFQKAGLAVPMFDTYLFRENW